MEKKEEIKDAKEEYLSKKIEKGTKLIERLKYIDDLISGRIQAKAMMARLSL